MTADDSMNQPERYRPTRFQRRCKHPKWRQVYKSLFTGAVDEQCVRCAMMRTTGGLLDFKFGSTS